MALLVSVVFVWFKMIIIKDLENTIRTLIYSKLIKLYLITYEGYLYVNFIWSEDKCVIVLSEWNSSIWLDVIIGSQYSCLLLMTVDLGDDVL